MSIYDYNIEQATSELLPPNKRKPTTLALLGVLVDKLQYMHDLFLGDYADGSSAVDWIMGNAYLYNDRVRYTDNAVYELVNKSGIVSTIPPNNDIQSADNPTGNWVKVLNVWVGSRERAKMNSQRIVFEYALNKWFKTTFRQPDAILTNAAEDPRPLSDIYINKNATDNTIFLIGVDEFESSLVTFSDEEQKKFITYEFVANTYTYTINVPATVYNALMPSDPPGLTDTKTNIIRAIADKYTLGGLTYNIAIY